MAPTCARPSAYIPHAICERKTQRNASSTPTIWWPEERFAVKWKTPQLYFFALAAAQPLTHYVALSDELLGIKANASALHHSQYHAPPLEGVTWVAEQVAAAAGLAAGARAEGFQGWF